MIDFFPPSTFLVRKAQMKTTWKWSEGNMGIRKIGYEKSFSCLLRHILVL